MMNENLLPSNVEYWSKILKSNPSHPQLNAFTFEEKYKIVEYAYQKIGLNSEYSYEQIANKLDENCGVSDELFNPNNQINRLAYWILGLWGSLLNLPRHTAEQYNFVKLSPQIWYYDGEQDEIDYGSYVDILHKMRKTEDAFSNWKETFNPASNAFEIDFSYKNTEYHWAIINESGGWMNGIVFKLYTDLCEKEYLSHGNYFMVMEGQGGYVMYLSYEAEEYLRTLWDFPKLNKQGKMMTLNDYGKLYDSKSK